MKNLYYTIVLFLIFCSCGKQNSVATLPIDKLYILEYNYAFPEEDEYKDPQFKFYVAGFCELDSNFNVKYARQLCYNSNQYYNSKDLVPDSMRNEISNTLLKYQTDTTFLYPREVSCRIYDGNAYRFIIVKKNQEIATIKFEPEFLPADLKVVYSYFYGDREKTKHKSSYSDLFYWFEEQVKDDGLLPIIKFTPPPVIKK